METLIARMKESSSAVADAVALLYAEQRSLKHTVLAENELLKARIATLENELRNRGIVHPDFPQILHSRVVDCQVAMSRMREIKVRARAQELKKRYVSRIFQLPTWTQ